MEAPSENATQIINQTAANLTVQESVPQQNGTATKLQQPATPSFGGEKYSSKVGISFNYPEAWNITETIDGKTITVEIPYANPQKIKNELKIHQIKISSTISTLSLFTAWIRQSFGFTGVATDATIGGNPANKMEQSIKTGPSTAPIIKKALMYDVINKGYGYYIYYLAVDSDYTASVSQVNDLVSSVSFS